MSSQFPFDQLHHCFLYCLIVLEYQSFQSRGVNSKHLCPNDINILSTRSINITNILNYHTLQWNITYKILTGITFLNRKWQRAAIFVGAWVIWISYIATVLRNDSPTRFINKYAASSKTRRFKAIVCNKWYIFKYIHI